MAVICKYRTALIIYFVIGSILSLIYTKEDVFAALEDLKLILRTEKELPNFLKSYFELAAKNPEIEGLAKPFLVSKFASVKNEEDFLSNPINIYLLIKRLTIEWYPLHTVLNPEVLKRVYSKFSELGKPIIFPTHEDLKGVARAFSRLQLMYDLDIFKVAKGEIIPGVKAAMELTAHDCHEIARQLNHQDEYIHAIPWLEASLAIEKQEKSKTINLLDILERFAFNSFKVRNFTRAFNLNKEILLYNPKHENANNNFEIYKTSTEIHEDEVIFHPDPYVNFKMYKVLCKNEYVQNKEKEANLKCSYYNKSPFLRLQPIKVEDLHLKPWVAMFYDIVSDKETIVIRNLSIPELELARVGAFQGRRDFVDYRVGKIAWINDNANPSIAKISTRLQELTGLNVIKGAEELQVLNYGIGGHYDPHYDFDIMKNYSAPPIIEEVDALIPGGDRIATVLIYLTDVQKGGATVFPELEIAASPKKGAAIFWYNIMKSGRGDSNTRHAACPVLLGNKWVSNKWIHEYHQEFRRPCGLTQSDLY